MVRIFLVNLIIITSLSSFLSGQKRDCFTDQYLQEEIKSNPRRIQILQNIEKHTRAYLTGVQSRSNATVTVPVVVHIVYKNAEENLSDEQIRSQIDILNQDFRRLNKDADNAWSQAADSRIEFCLASVDAQGGPTNGVTRTLTRSSSFGTSGNDIKYTSRNGKDAWPSDSYLNIWVGDISGTVLGYSQFPGGDKETDGVVIDYKVFGTGPNVTPKFHLGRTTTHEVGHWLNLRHIWGNGDCIIDDYVADTPMSDGPNFGCNRGRWSCGSIDMVQNYMDYSDDNCMNLFTQGQRDRMLSLFDQQGARFSITKSKGCSTPSSPTTECSKVNLEIKLDNYPQETTWEIKDDKGITVWKGGKYLSNQKNSVLNIDTCLRAGCYQFYIYDAYNDGICCKYGAGYYKVSLDGKIIGEGGNFGKSALHSFCIASNVSTCTDGIKNGSETGIDCGGTTCAPCATCNDGIKNGTETGIDCGGPTCAPCMTCNDGIKNGTETGIDCGGPTCAPCTSCNDGIKNGSETGIDCGGSTCAPCATCNDGIKNGTETGIDCGGSTCAPCNIIGNGPTTNNGQLHAAYFETGWDGWDGGSLDTERYSGYFSWEGNYSIMIRDDSGDGSSMNSPAMDLRPFDKIKIEFAFYPNSMEKDEDFWLMYHDGVQWHTLKAYVSETDFFNNHFYEATFIMNRSQYAFIQNGKFRFQCDASTNADQVYIDEVRITGLLPGARDVSYSNKLKAVGYFLGDEKQSEVVTTSIFPNPTTDIVNIISKDEIHALNIFDMNGRSMMYKPVEDTELTLDVSHLPRGVYTLSLNMDSNIISKKIIKN